MAKQFVLEKVGGLRTFFGIQPNSFKSEPDWEDKMFELECVVEENSVYASMSAWRNNREETLNLTK